MLSFTENYNCFIPVFSKNIQVQTQTLLCDTETYEYITHFSTKKHQCIIKTGFGGLLNAILLNISVNYFSHDTKVM
jgi:hypothetical protein